MIREDVTEYSIRQSMAFDSWVSTRIRKALLRSQGHLFRDGRWTEDSEPFHVFHEEEPCGRGSSMTFLCGNAYLGGGDFLDASLLPCQWIPMVSRGYSSEAFGPFPENKLPKSTEKPFSDFVLELNAQGTEFIKRNRPGNPVEGLGQFLVELRQIPQLPIFLKSRTKSFSDLGREYLNIEFGWKPFLKDLVAFFHYQRKLEHQLKKLISNNGRQIRKRSKKKDVIDQEVVCEGSLSVPFGRLDDVGIGGNSELERYAFCGPFGALATYPGFPGQSDYRYDRILTSTTWECGTFFYYVPDIGSDQWTAKAKSVLLGSNPNPSVLYQVLPWSWLIDWFGNVGDIVSNLTTNAVDNEALTNCYAMRTDFLEHRVEVSSHWDEINQSEGLNTDFFLPAGEAVVISSRSETIKLRQQSSPYGFGLKRGDFTPRQLAILAALAIAKVNL